MPYANATQMVDRFTEREVIALTDHADTGEVDVVKLDKALVEAGAEIDSHLGRRYAMPLSQAGVVMATPPVQLVGICCDIARYRLTGTEVQETEAIRYRYKDAITTLKLLADGLMVFPETPDLLAASSPNAAGSAVATNERCRLFGRDTLGTY